MAVVSVLRLGHELSFERTTLKRKALKQFPVEFQFHPLLFCYVIYVFLFCPASYPLNVTFLPVYSVDLLGTLKLGYFFMKFSAAFSPWWVHYYYM
jgi:hypothetical protein